jgi:hypothetical protein
MLILKSSASERSVDSASHPRARFLPKPPKQPLLSLRVRVCHPNTCIYVRLLGPCFKTGGRKPFRQHREPSNRQIPHSTHFSHRQNFVLSRARAGRHRVSSLSGRVIMILDQIQRRVRGLNKPEGMHQPQDFLRRF